MRSYATVWGSLPSGFVILRGLMTPHTEVNIANFTVFCAIHRPGAVFSQPYLTIGAFRWRQMATWKRLSSGIQGEGS